MIIITMREYFLHVAIKQSNFFSSRFSLHFSFLKCCPSRNLAITGLFIDRFLRGSRLNSLVKLIQHVDSHRCISHFDMLLLIAPVATVVVTLKAWQILMQAHCMLICADFHLLIKPILTRINGKGSHF